MTFSIRTFLIVIAILACWLGALVSKAPLLIELAATATGLLILLTLALAIWDSRPERRAFWTGFFVLGLGNLLLAHFFSAYQTTGTQVATLLLGDPATVYSSTFSAPPAVPSSPLVTYYTPVGPGANYSTTTYNPLPQNTDYYQQHSAIRTSIPSLLSLLVGSVGGWLTLWVARQSRTLPGADRPADLSPRGT